MSEYCDFVISFRLKLYNHAGFITPLPQGLVTITYRPQNTFSVKTYWIDDCYKTMCLYSTPDDGQIKLKQNVKPFLNLF